MFLFTAQQTFRCNKTESILQTIIQMGRNSLPNDKVLDWSKLKAFADENLYVDQMMIYVFERVENVGNGENAGLQHFLVFPQCFLKLSFSGSRMNFNLAWLPFTTFCSIFHNVLKGFFPRDI